MSDLDAPPRLGDMPETPPELAELLREARGDGLDAGAASRIGMKVARQVGGPVGGTPASGGLSRLVPWVVGAAGGAGLVGALVWLGADREVQSPPPPPPSAVLIAAPQPTNSDVTVESSAAPEASSPASSSRAAAPADERPEPIASQAKPQAARPEAQAAPAASASARAIGGSLVEEHQLLREARRALPTNPSRALALTREHARRFPQGVLAQEREVLMIQALEATGRHDDAMKQKDSFEERYPDSPHRDALGADAGAHKK